MKKVSYILCLILLVIFIDNVSAASYTYRARILYNNTNLRPDPGGVDGTRLGLLDANDYYNLVSDKLYDDINNHKRCKGGWYNITYYTGVDGYVCSDDIELIKSYSKDDETASTACEKEMAELGFPSSYWGGLCSLKEKHPTWQFQAVNTNLDWAYAILRESDCGVNYIHNKTYDQTFFDPTCTSTSPGGYIAPSQKALAYYMDPRNFFTEKYMFQFLDQAYDSNLDTIYLPAVLGMIEKADFYLYHKNLGTNLDEMIYNSGKAHAVSPIFIGARIANELGSGTSLYNLYSGIFQDEKYGTQYLGYYNFFNFGVTDSCVQENGTTYCGLNYAQKKGWNSVENAINGGVSQLANSYIGKGQYTGYFQKYNVVPTVPSQIFAHQYMTNVAAPISESKQNYNAYSRKNLLESNFVFKVPVYLNMAETITNGNSGAVDEEEKPKPSSIPIHTIVTSSGYRYQTGYISNILPGTDANTLKSALEAVSGGGSVIITNKNGEEITGILGTGNKVTINNLTTTEVLEVIIKGDTSGDGVINALDLLQVQKNILGTYNLEGAHNYAADTSKDGVINALDLLQIQKSILGTYTIEQ